MKTSVLYLVIVVETILLSVVSYKLYSYLDSPKEPIFACPCKSPTEVGAAHKVDQRDVELLKEGFDRLKARPVADQLSDFVSFPKELLCDMANDYKADEITHFLVRFGVSSIHQGVETKDPKLTVWFSPAVYDPTTRNFIDLGEGPGARFNRYDKGHICPPSCD